MTVYCADISNFTSDLSVGALEAWKSDSITHVIVQAVDPPPGYPPGKARDQIAFCAANGMTVDAYIWLWMDLSVDDINRKLALLDGLPVRRLWLDVEDTAAEKYDQATCEAKVADALKACDLWGQANGHTDRTGIYSGPWFWQAAKYMGDTTAFSDRDLWTAEYNGIEDTEHVTLYGGWTTCAIHQYVGTMGLHGIWGIDLNVLSPEEEAKLTGESGGDGGDMANCQQYRDALERVVNRLQIENDRKTSTGKLAAIRRTITREIASEAFQVLQSAP